MKRTRGRRRPSGGNTNGHQHNNNPNRSFDSNGPDVKVRGSAVQIYEKYQQLARDASSSGDRVLAENYLQHAEHYYRVLRAMQPQRPAHELLPNGEADEGSDDDRRQNLHNNAPQHPTQQHGPQPQPDMPSGSNALDVLTPQSSPGFPQPALVADIQPDALPAFLHKPVFTENTRPAPAEGEEPKRRAPRGAPRRKRFDADATDAKAAEVAASPHTDDTI